MPARLSGPDPFFFVENAVDSRWSGVKREPRVGEVRVALSQRQLGGAPHSASLPSRAALDGTVDLARDRDLVERCQGGDRTAFEELYHRYNRRLFHFCVRRLHEQHEAEDAVQEAFTRAWRAMPSFAGERRFYPWLTVIAGNVCTDVLRRRSRLTPMEDLPLPLVGLDGDVDEALLGQVDAAMAIEALEHLSERHQRVLALREGSGWSTQQLAEHEGVAVPAMETLLWRARQALKREFAALADTSGRLGVALGLGIAAMRRLLARQEARLGDRMPALQAMSMSVKGPSAVVASLVIAGGVASGFIVTAHHHTAQPTTVSMPVMVRTLAASSSSIGSQAPTTTRRAKDPASPTRDGTQSTGGSGSAATPGTGGTVSTGSSGSGTSTGGIGAGSLTLPGSGSNPSTTLPTVPSGSVPSLGTTVSGATKTLGSTASNAVGNLTKGVSGVTAPVTSGVTSVVGAVTSLTGSSLGITSVVSGLGGVLGGLTTTSTSTSTSTSSGGTSSGGTSGGSSTSPSSSGSLLGGL